MRRARIALVSDAVLPFHKGGKETRIYHLTKQLLSLGFEVDIYTMCWWGNGPVFRYDGVNFYALSKYRPLYVGNRRSIMQALLFGFSCLKLFAYDFDVLEVDHMPYFPLFFAKIVSVLKRKRLYATWHEVWGLAYWREYLGSVAGYMAYAIERCSVLLPDHIIAVSQPTYDNVKERLHYKGPLSLIANGIDEMHIAMIKPAPQSSDIIYAGRLVSHKNVDVLIMAIDRLRFEFASLRCLIIGDGPERARLERLVTHLSLQGHVQFLGSLPEADEVLAYMKASKVFVLPSTREGFGISVLEAYACGLPVVTIDHPENAARLLIREGYGRTCSLSVPALVEAIRNILVAPPKLKRAFVKEFDWKKSAVSLEKVYNV